MVYNVNLVYWMYRTACFIPPLRNVNVRGRIALSVKCVYIWGARLGSQDKAITDEGWVDGWVDAWLFKPQFL